MEALYSKLYNKYKTLKKEKESQFDKLNHDQEVKFLNYADAADEMVQYLKSENEKLDGQVDQYKSELASIKSSIEEQQINWQKLLAEEKQKNKELVEEIGRLQKPEQNVCSYCTTRGEIGRGQASSHDDASAGSLTKKRKYVHNAEGTTTPCDELDCPEDQHFYGYKSTDVTPSILQPACCQKRIYSSGGDGTDTSLGNCVFQYLVELAVGMKVSPLSQSNEPCIVAHHQSSGYSFSLTWITNSHGEVELLYRVLSLGTFERIAPEWMKETLMFSTSMCPVFFERVSRVIKC